MIRVYDYLKMNDAKEKGIDADHFIALLKRMVAADCREVIFVGGVAISCYDVNDDADERAHNHIYPIQYDDPLYNGLVMIEPKKILPQITDLIKRAETERKSYKIKPSKKKVSITYDPSDSLLYLKYEFLDDTVNLPPYVYPIKMGVPTELHSRRCQDCINKMMNGYMANGVIIQEDPEVLQSILEGSPRVLYRDVEVCGVNVTYPYIKSYLYGLKKPDMLLTHICQMDVGKYTGVGTESITDSVYACNLIACKGGIVEIHSSYITNF